MLEQAEDFRQESLALERLLADLDPSWFDRHTQFKSWTINDVLQHLHFWNLMADLSLTDEARFTSMLQQALARVSTLKDFESEYLDGLAGPGLLAAWSAQAGQTADHYAAADPKKRLKWAGPDMSARSSITARLMETWAHGQAIYDLLGIERQDTDRIRNVAHLGVQTFGWTYVARGLEVPRNPPYVRLEAPSGAVWEWNPPDQENQVSGSATEFCQVVTQTRNIEDTELGVVGDTAAEWMSMAQCFAGPPHAPPAPGTRFIQRASP